MKPENFCLGCMNRRKAGATCPVCGWKHNSAPESGLYLLPGSMLKDKYLIGRPLGVGGFGITYLAFDQVLNVKSCIKEYLPTDLATRTQDHPGVSVYTGEKKEHFQYGLDKFLEEGRALAQFLEHPGIVSVRDYFQANNTAYLVMQYLEGKTLREYVYDKGNKIDYETAREIMMPVMDALREVHKTGLLHRDIAPDNIFITKDGQVKILDFGAARYSMGEYSKSLSVVLKPGFAPEEQYRSRGKQGPWTDIYATAATFYRAITGELPPESLDRLDEDTLVPPSQKGVTIPPPAEAALLKAMAIRAAGRYQSMAEFQHAMMGMGAPEKSEPVEKEPSLIEVGDVSPKKEETVKSAEKENPGPEKTASPEIGSRKSKALKIGVGIALGIILAVIAVVIYSGKESKSKLTTEASVQETAMPMVEKPQRISNDLGMEFVYIKPGRFMMGSPAGEPDRDDDEVQHEVILSQGYYLQTTEVTQGQWKAVTGSLPSEVTSGSDGTGSNYPVYYVSWEDTKAFIRELNRREGKYNYHLPTEAQWEYACRGGTNTQFNTGACLSTDQANYDGNYPYTGCSKGTYREKTLPVGSFFPNAWELYDMHGNVWEWCEDWQGSYPSGSVTDPQGPSSGTYRVFRGGSCFHLARFCRSAFRLGSTPGIRNRDLGFRLVLEVSN